MAIGVRKRDEDLKARLDRELVAIDAMTGVVYTTVAEGRPTKGMPPWKGVLSDERIWKILTFLESVQTEP